MVVIFLSIIGLVAVSSSSAYIADLHYKRSTYFFEKQLIYTIIGILAMIVGMRIEFYQLKKLIKMSMSIVMILLLLTYFPVLGGITVNGANGWYKIPVINFTFQPSEIAKIVLIIYVSNILSNEKYYTLNIPNKILTMLPIICTLGIIVFQPDMGNTFVIFSSIFVIYMVSEKRFFRLFLILTAISPIIYIIISKYSYMSKRIEGFLDPWSDPLGKGYQLIQSLYAIGSGGITGRGFGESIQKRFYLPESHTDFIFSVICEEGGLIWSSIILILIFMLAHRGYNIAINSKDLFLKFMATGITTLIVIQSITNICVATGLLPTTGITLPFISYGGTAIIIEFFCIGLLLNISMYTTNKWYVL
jgi:cell division protein FtsW